MIQDFPVFTGLMVAEAVQGSKRALAIRRMDNLGSQWLASNYPHLLSQLEELTQDWVLMPKAVLRSKAVLHQMVVDGRANMEIGSFPLPESVSPAQFREMMNRLFMFLENEVLPVMDRMPAAYKENVPTHREVVESLGLAPEVAEEVLNGDDAGTE